MDRLRQLGGEEESLLLSKDMDRLRQLGGEEESLLLSKDMDRLRQLGGEEESLLISLVSSEGLPKPRYWFRITDEYGFLSIEFPALPLVPIRSVHSSGPSVYLVCGSQVNFTRVFAYDCKNIALSHCSPMPVETTYRKAALVGDELYILGKKHNERRPFAPNHNKLRCHSFNITKQLWEQGPNDFVFVKPYQLENISRYSMTRIKMTGTLVGYYSHSGLMWYDQTGKEWYRVVGLTPMEEAKSVAAAEFKGKLALLWTKTGDIGITKTLHLTTISLEKNDTGFSGLADLCLIIGEIPQDFDFSFCISMSV